MRGLVRLFIRVSGIGLLLSQAALSQQPITLENSELRVSLSPQNATLLSVDNKRINASYLGSSQQPGWFRIQIPLPYWEGHAAASNDLKVVKVQQLGPDAVEFRAAELVSKEGTQPVSVKLTLRLEGDNLVAKLSFENHTRQTIDRIFFPMMGVPAAEDSKETLVMPQAEWPLRRAFSENDIRSYHSPIDTMNLVDRKAWFFVDPKISAKAFNYPEALATAWMMYRGDGRGIGFDSRAQQFQFQKLIIERRLYRDTEWRENNRKDYELTWNWFPLVPPGTSWESPEVYIKFDNGDWHGIACQHREWLKTWIRRPNVAKEFQSSIGWMSNGWASPRPWNYDEIPRIAQQGVKVGAPYFIVYRWAVAEAAEFTYEAHPVPELGGLRALQKNLKKARELGAHPMAWFNGTLSGDTRREHLALGKKWIALDRWGGGIPDGNWSLYGGIQPLTVPSNEVWLQLDPSGSKDLLVANIRRFIEDYGFTGFEMDQGYKYFFSYRDAAQNAHPGLAYAKGYADFYERVTRLVKEHDPDGIIVGEGYSDFMNQYVDSSWVYEGGGGDPSQLSRLRYSLPWVTVPVRADVQKRGHANQAFMMNAPLDIFDDLAQHAEYAQHLERLHALKKATTHYFFQGDFSDQEGFSLQSGQRGVAAKSYRGPDHGFLTVVVINATGSPQEVTLRPAENYASRQIRRFCLDGRAEIQKPSPEVSLQLAAYDVQVLAFESR